jgi:type IV secretion system protein VirB2
MHLPHLLPRVSESGFATTGSRRFTALLCAATLLLAALPALAGSPFATGANAAQSNVLAILTPVAAIAVMGSGALAWFGRISWLWFIGAIIGTVLVFGAPQIVAWIRSMFGV